SNSGALIVDRSAYLQLATAISGTGTLQKLGSGTLDIAANNTYSGATTISAGTLSIGTGGTAGSVAGNIANSGSLVFNRSDASTYAGSISGSGGMTKLGTGSLTLSGSSTNTGAMLVSAGELKLNGTTGTGAVTIASAATLSGTGTIRGATTISGTHTPGNSPGIQTFTSDLTYAQQGVTGPKVFWELSGNTTSNSPLAYDQVNVGGNLDFQAGTSLALAFGGPGSAVDWSNPFWSHWQQWTVYNVSGTTTGVSNLLLEGSPWADSTGAWLSAVRPGYTFYIAQIGQNVVIEFVPEPSTYALAVVGLAVAGLRHLKKRRAARAARMKLAA
ncbi:MAG: autotransporter-associated beta strand repeat-containing protein, partial [Planctomycetota bacterium]